jgi:hypothetical protein
MRRSFSKGTSESLPYSALQRCLVQDTGAAAVPELIHISRVLTKCTYDKESVVEPTNRALFSDDVSPSLVGPEFLAMTYVIDIVITQTNNNLLPVGNLK